MKTALFSSLLSVLMGSVIFVGGTAMHVDNILADAHAAVNGVNLHQMATVLELYYLDHDAYPRVAGGEALVDIFEEEGYILNRPLDPSVFSYQSLQNGQNYRLALAQ